MKLNNTRIVNELRDSIRKILVGVIDDIDGVLRNRGKETTKALSSTIGDMLLNEWDKGKDKLKNKISGKGELDAENRPDK